jgi:cytochrome P450
VPDLRLADPDTFRDGPPHAALRELRRRAPVAWQDHGESGFFAVLTHSGVVEVARRTDVYSASRGGVVLEDLEPAALEMMRHMLLAMDPPRHQLHRRPLVESFKPSVIAGLEGQVREICRAVVRDAGERGEVEFVHDVAARVPTQVIGKLMGLPEADWEYLHGLAQRQTSSQDADIAAAAPGGRNPSVEMAMYAIEFAAQRRTEAPRADLTTLILETDFGGTPMSDVDFGSFFVQLVTAGNDTTTTLLSAGLHTLLRNPGQLSELRTDPGLLPGAVEEILRFANPLHYFRRTTTVDAVLHGVPIPAGSKVAMYYTAANRDEAVFADPDRFDIHRSPNRHLSFGVAEHFCLGAHLARLEARVFFEELLAAFERIELCGEPARVRSNLNNGYKRLPVRLAAGA